MVSVVLTEDPEDLRKKRKEQWWGPYNDTKWSRSNRWRSGKRAASRPGGAPSAAVARVDAIDATPRRFDGCTALLLLVLAFYIPFSIAFLDVGDFIWFDWYQLVWFSVDIILSFCSPYENEEGWVTNPEVDRGGVLPMFFWVDTISTFPLRVGAGGVGRRVAADEAAQDASFNKGAARAQDDEADASPTSSTR